jgi:hypothetical protein
VHSNLCLILKHLQLLPSAPEGTQTKGKTTITNIVTRLIKIEGLTGFYKGFIPVVVRPEVQENAISMRNRCYVFGLKVAEFVVSDPNQKRFR